MQLAADGGLRSLAFPAISTGVYGFPLERATRIAVAEVSRALEGQTSVAKAIFCCFSAGDRQVYERVLDERERG
jgi:O-acetyl-ADP-ribose deacetylase (regulator of RNase III)